jgi:hypothetical protein
MIRKSLTGLTVMILTLCTLKGQSTFGTIVGVVQDQTQAVVQGASIQIRNLNDNSIHTTVSAADGTFALLNLKAGRYTVSVEREGFKEFTIASRGLKWCWLSRRQGRPWK